MIEKCNKKRNKHGWRKKKRFAKSKRRKRERENDSCNGKKRKRNPKNENDPLARGVVAMTVATDPKI